MGTEKYFAANCRIFDDLSFARPGDRLFISTRPLTLNRRGSVPPGLPFSEAALNPDDIDFLLESGEIILVGTLNKIKAAEYQKKYLYLAEERVKKTQKGGQKL